MTSKQLQGFKTISICFSNNSTSTHTMFMKEHSVRHQTDDKPIGRTLYLINVPPWSTQQSLVAAFTQAAGVPIESCTFTHIKDTTNSGFKAAYIVFKSEKALYKALTIKELPPLATTTEPICMGLLKWVMEYNQGLTEQYSREQEMLAIIKEYDADEALKKAKEKAQETDDEGWTVVGKKGRNPGLSRKESLNEKLMAKTKKEKVLKGFYRHQIRQAKKDQLAALRKRADEDKKKILALRQRRAFKPY